MSSTKELFVSIGLSVEKAEETLKNASLAKSLECSIREVRVSLLIRITSVETGNTYTTGPQARGQCRLDCWQVSLQCSFSCEIRRETNFCLQVHCNRKDCVRPSDNWLLWQY